jgi:alpha-tubulin suppressor-like RCC1 family protein
MTWACASGEIAGLTDAAQVAVDGEHACVRRHSGQVSCFAPRGPLVDIPEVPDAIDVSAGRLAACAVRADHTAWCWGQRSSWILYGGSAGAGDVKPTRITGLTDVATISLGVDHACVRKTDSTVWCWGINQLGQLGDGTTTSRTQPASVSGLDNVVQVSAGSAHTCALRKDGTITYFFRIPASSGSTSPSSVSSL